MHSCIFGVLRGIIISDFFAREEEDAMNFRELSKRLRSNIGEDNLLLRFLLEDAERELGVMNQSCWQELDLVAEDVVDFYEFVSGSLWRRAVAFASSSDDPVYKESTDVASMIRQFIHGEFGVDLPEMTFVAPSSLLLRKFY